MSVLAKCPDCGRQYKLPDSSEGKTLRCKDCGEPFTVAGGKRSTKSTRPRRTAGAPKRTRRSSRSEPRAARSETALPARRKKKKTAKSAEYRSGHVLDNTLAGDGPGILKVIIASLVGAAFSAATVAKGGGATATALVVAAVAGGVVGGLAGLGLTFADKIKKPAATAARLWRSCLALSGWSLWVL